MDIRQCFQILELDSDASIEDVNRAYKDMVAVWHPDRFSSNPRLKRKAEEKLKIINQAYEKVLSFLSSNLVLQRAVYDHGKQTSPQQDSHSNGTLKKIIDKYPLYSRKEIAGDSQLRPWIRFFARVSDYLLFGFLLRFSGIGNMLLETEISLIAFPAMLTFAWIIPESCFLCVFGTTPGKWLFRITMVDIFQLKPKFLSVLRRSLSVWCNGVGMGIFFIAPFTAAFSVWRMKTKGHTIWDRDARFSVKHKKIGAPRVAIAFLCSAVMVLFLILGPNIMIEACRQAVRMNPDNPHAFLKLGASYAKAGRFEEAVAAYIQAIKIKPEDALAYHELGVCYFELERYDEALSQFKKSMALKPDFAKGFFDLGMCYTKLSLYSEAVEAFKQAVEIRPEFAQAYHEIGVCYVELKQYREAMEASNQAIDNKPDYAPAHYNLGICLFELQRIEEAIKSFKIAIQINKNDAACYYNLGRCYIELGQYNDAVLSLKKAVRIKPRNAEALYSLGIGYAKLGRTDDAIEVLEQVVKINPNYAQAYHVLGLSYLTLGNKAEALDQYQRLKDIDKSLSDELLDYIENMPALDEG